MGPHSPFPIPQNKKNLSQKGLVVTNLRLQMGRTPDATAYGTGQAVPELTFGLLLLLGMAGLALCRRLQRTPLHRLTA